VSLALWHWPIQVPVRGVDELISTSRIKIVHGVVGKERDEYLSNEE
jgi:hypothetical protein